MKTRIRKYRFVYSLVFAIGLPWMITPAQVFAEGKRWIIHQVVLGQENYSIYKSSIAIDSQNIPHISFHDKSSGEVKYASFNGSSWDIEVVDSVGANDVGSTSLAFDKNDIPHISYYEGNNHRLKYARRIGSTWHTEAVSGPSTNGRASSLAIDSDNFPHISWSGSGYAFMYSKWTGFTWETTTIASEARHNSIGLDNNNTPHISYFIAGSDNYLKYATYNGTSWDTEIVDLPPPSGAYGSRNTLTLDGNNLPHIAYSIEKSGDNPNNSIKYAKWTGTNWEMEMVESTSTAWYSSVALSLTGSTPHICYTTSTGGSLHYSYKNETSWINETVDPNDDVFDASISLDSNGCSHISYSTVDGLKYASKCDTFPWPMFLPAIINNSSL